MDCKLFVNGSTKVLLYLNAPRTTGVAATSGASMFDMITSCSRALAYPCSGLWKLLGRLEALGAMTKPLCKVGSSNRLRLNRWDIRIVEVDEFWILLRIDVLCYIRWEILWVIHGYSSLAGTLRYREFKMQRAKPQAATSKQCLI